MKHSPSAGLETASCTSDAMQPDSPATHRVAVSSERAMTHVDARIARVYAGLTVCDVVVPVPGELRQRVLAVLVRGEEAGVRRARAHHHRRHAADGPAHNVACYYTLHIHHHVGIIANI